MAWGQTGDHGSAKADDNGNKDMSEEEYYIQTLATLYPFEMIISTRWI